MKFKERAHKSTGKGDFLKIKDGESKIGVFRGEIHEFWQLWPMGGEKQVFDKPTQGASHRFKVNFIEATLAGIEPKASVWEFPETVYDFLSDLNKEMDLEKTKVKISRRGSGTDTRYTIIPLGPITDSGENVLRQVKLNILNSEQPKPQKLEDPPMPSSDDMPYFGEEVEVPF